MKDSTMVKMANIETFVITGEIRTQKALYNQKLSSFNISSATCYPRIFFVYSARKKQPPSKPEIVRRLAKRSFIFHLIFICKICGNKNYLITLRLIKYLLVIDINISSLILFQFCIFSIKITN